MKKEILAAITCVIVLAFCGCEEIEHASEEFSSEISSRLSSYQDEPQSQSQTQSEKEEAAGEVAEIYYSYHKLSEAEQGLYLEILDALVDLSEEKSVSAADSAQLDRIFECVLNDHPELFYVEGFQYTEHFFGDTLTGISFKGTYSMTREEAQEALSQINQSLSECMREVPLNEDEYSTVKFLYEYLIDNTEYDKDADNNQNIRSVFLGGRSVCQGYAKAMQYMLQKVGMQSFLVTGYTGAERHAWNLVRVNGNYYYLDPTWGDASYSYSGNGGEEAAVFLPPINYDYFLVTTNEIAKTHSFEELVELPVCESNEDNYYVREGLYFEGYDRQQLENIFDSEAVKKEDYVTLKCADRNVYSEMLAAVIDAREIFGIIENNGGTISYAFNEELCTISFWNIFY